jgi:hypothetical protein
MRVRVAIPDRLLDRATIEPLLEAVTRAGVRQIQRGEARDFRDVLESGGVRWQPEKFVDGEHFDLPALAQKRRWGDCDDLGPWYAASLRASGDDPQAKAVARRSGPNRWHVVTQRGDKRIEDPSKWAGMRPTISGPAAGVRALAARPMAYPGDGAIAITRGLDGVVPWWSRVDLPWQGRSHMASLAPGRTPHGAMTRAVMGALDMRDGCSPDHVRFADVVAGDLLCPEEGDEGAFLPPLAKLLCARRAGQRVLRDDVGSVAWSPRGRGPLVVRF